MSLVVKNWSRYQHYKDRCPPWIKLATDTFQNYEFSRLQDASKLLAICIWTLASRSRTGEVPDDFDYLKAVGCLGSFVKREHLEELVTKGFLERTSDMLADCEQSDCSETEGETEERRGRSGANQADLIAPEPPVLVFPTSGDPDHWDLTRRWADEAIAAFPGIDVLADLRVALAKVKNGATRKPTARGMSRFLMAWLSRTNDNGRPRSNGGTSGSTFNASSTAGAALLARQRAETNG